MTEREKRPTPKNHHPIPSHAKTVFEGIRYKILQWEQELFDGNKTTFESLKRGDSVAIYATLPDDKIIINKERQAHWPTVHFSIPGGGVEEGEDVFEAASRELLEETGASFKNLYLVSVEQLIPHVDWNHYTFVAKGLISQGEVSPDPGESIAPLEISFEKFIDMIRKKEFFYRPYLAEDYIVQDKISEFFDLLRNPEKYQVE